MPLSDVRTVLMLGPHMNVLLELPVDDARTIVAQSRQHNDLVWLLPFLSAMSSRQINLTIDRIINSPVVLRKLESEHARNALINSSDFAGYLDSMLPPAGFSDRAVVKKSYGGFLFGAGVALLAILVDVEDSENGCGSWFRAKAARDCVIRHKVRPVDVGDGTGGGRRATRVGCGFDNLGSGTWV